MRYKKLLCLLIIIFILILNNTPTVRSLAALPQRQILLVGDESSYNFGFPISVDIKTEKNGLLKINNKVISTNKYSASLSSINIKPESIGKAILDFNLFGLIPIRSVTLDVVPRKYEMVGGQSIGVKLNTKGVIVVGFSDITGIDGKTYSPGKAAGIRFGDIILKIDGRVIENTDTIIDIMRNSKKASLKLQVKRDDRILDLLVHQVKSKDDGEYKLGLWVRDHTSGIGTLTFVNPDNNTFGALGHPITDMDTGQMLTIKDGEIMFVHVTSIQKGRRSQPGEIKGIFIEGKDTIGEITRNTKYGIYGKLYKSGIINNKIYPIAYQSQIKPGPAKILTMLDDDKVKEYNIEIQKTVKQDVPNPKSMIIKITDPELLKRTGGIVQGMSGSPIIQDNKLVGAVTHVFVNDPTRGYGIYIEWMIREAEISTSPRN